LAQTTTEQTAWRTAVQWARQRVAQRAYGSAATMAAHWAVLTAVPRADYWELRSVATMEMPMVAQREQSWAASMAG
jgi:hypothetical protein